MSAAYPDLNDFLHSLATWMVATLAARGSAAAAGTGAVTVEYAGTPRGLWLYEAVEDPGEILVADPYSVLRPYGGPPTTKDPLPRASLQVMTAGRDNAAAAAQAQALFSTLFYPPDDARQPLHPVRMITIPGLRQADGADDAPWQVVSFDPTSRPGLIGRDERGRPKVSFNFDVGFVQLAEQ